MLLFLLGAALARFVSDTCTTAGFSGATIAGVARAHAPPHVVKSRSSSVHTGSVDVTGIVDARIDIYTNENSYCNLWQ